MVLDYHEKFFELRKKKTGPHLARKNNNEPAHTSIVKAATNYEFNFE